MPRVVTTNPETWDDVAFFTYTDKHVGRLGSHLIMFDGDVSVSVDN